jgi:2-phosphosulfolactate phosphatase
MRDLRVHFLPELIAPDDLAGSTCVVIDVLRATTTMIYALAAGATAVIPRLTIDDARQRAGVFPAGQAILGGERGGLKIEGFDVGNSPAEYSPAIVGGKTIVLTTTNGTKALLYCQQAAEVLIGAFVNLSAVCSVLSKGADSINLPLPLGEGRGEGFATSPMRPHPNPLPKGEGTAQTDPTHTETSVNLICAGTDGEITREDVLLAGAIVARLTENGEKGEKGAWHLNDQAAVAQDAWLRIMAHAAPADVMPRLIDAMRASQGGRNLIALGMQRDIELASEVDRFDITPQYAAASGLVARDSSSCQPDAQARENK